MRPKPPPIAPTTESPLSKPRKPHRIILPDPGHSQLEARYFCLGLVQGRVLTVRFTLRDAKVRLIGVGYWRAYRKLYHEKQTR